MSLLIKNTWKWMRHWLKSRLSLIPQPTIVYENPPMTFCCLLNAVLVVKKTYLIVYLYLKKY